MYLKLNIMAACLFVALSLAAPTQAKDTDCKAVSRQEVTTELEAMVNDDPALRASLAQSIELGQRVNSDPRTNPVANLEDYYDFVDALVTYNPQNIDTKVHNGKIRISMDGDKYCNWNILDILSYSYFLVDRQISTDP